MNLDPKGCEFYILGITTQPAVASWDASFDGGTSYHTGEPTPGQTNSYRWLVAGPSAPPEIAAPAVATITGWSVVPKVRASTNPELVVRSAPRISVNR